MLTRLTGLIEITENLKKYYLLSDSLKARDASASKKFIADFPTYCQYYGGLYLIKIKYVNKCKSLTFPKKTQYIFPKDRSEFFRKFIYLFGYLRPLGVRGVYLCFLLDICTVSL